MKLFKMKGNKLGLLVLLPTGPHLIDVLGSIRIFGPHDPLSNGLLNGALMNGCDWSLIVKNWEYLRLPLKKLALIAKACPDHPQLVIVPLDEQQSHAAADPIAALAITDIDSFDEIDPTGYRAMHRQLARRAHVEATPDVVVATESAQVINFVPPNK